MNSSLLHRGPDGGNELFIEQHAFSIGLAHRRLAILELSELGNQPMSFQKIHVVFNGEIYNFKEIKKELIILGHQFQSESDTEMLLHAYKEWGTDCLQKFIGMFVFLLFDEEKNQLFIARDRAGVKPLFLYLKNSLFLFASELKAFHAHPQFEKLLNSNSVYSFLQYGAVPSPHCIFENCLKLQPGHFIHVSLNQQISELKQVQYWNVYEAYNLPILEIPEKELIQSTEKLIKSACEYRMISDVPVGVFLSGGYDSTAVTAILQKDRTEKLKTFTISVPDIGLNEAKFAKNTAAILGTSHTEINCSANEAIDIVKSLPYFYDEPFADSSAIPTTLVSSIARESVTVALSADGGDEVFGGYNRYEMLLKYHSKIKKIPRFAQKIISKTMGIVPAHQIPILKNKYNFANRYEKTKNIFSDFNERNLMKNLAELFTDSQIQLLAKKPYNKPNTFFDSEELKQHSPLRFAMAMDYQTYLLDDILQKVDRASMSVSLESREPFLDHRLIEFAAQLPDNVKIRNGEKKWLLKEIVHQYIPKKEMDRPKMGFAIPIEKWLKNELREQLDYFLSEEKIEKTKLFNTEYILNLKNQFLDGKNEFGTKIWYLLSYMMWHERWMN